MNKFRWKERVRKEYGVPIKEVVMRFIEKRFSKNKCVASLGIDHSTLKRYCEQEKIVWCSRKELNDYCKPRPFNNKNNPWGCKGRGQHERHEL